MVRRSGCASEGTVRSGEVYRRSMPVTRKELLAGGAALALAGCGAKKRAIAAPAAAGGAPDWGAVRDAFALDPAARHFDGFLFAANPRPVREAIERHRRGFDSGANDSLHEH